MARYIEANKTADIISEKLNIPLGDLVDVFAEIPTADVVEVKHGEWKRKGQDIYCSVCGNESAYNPFGASKFSDYCPNCGADMRGDKSDL